MSHIQTLQTISFFDLFSFSSVLLLVFGMNSIGQRISTASKKPIRYVKKILVEKYSQSGSKIEYISKKEGKSLPQNVSMC